MSAPKTDLDKQEKRHKAPLLGMRAVVLWALVLLVLLIIFLAVRGNDPGDGVPVTEEQEPAAVETD